MSHVTGLCDCVYMYVCVVCLCACVCVVFICTHACLHEVSPLFVVCPFPSKYTFLLCIIIFSACITSLATFVSLSRSLALSLSRSPGLSRARVRALAVALCFSLSLYPSLLLCVSLSPSFSLQFSLNFSIRFPLFWRLNCPAARCSTLQHTAQPYSTLQQSLHRIPAFFDFLYRTLLRSMRNIALCCAKIKSYIFCRGRFFPMSR